MSRTILVDTGPLVAFLNRRDGHHAWAVAELGRVATPLVTCDSVLSEACFLLREHSPADVAIVQMAARGLLSLPLRLQDEAAAITRLMKKYTAVPMSLADACLVRLAEMHSDCVLLTTDGDFDIYRRNGRQVIPTRMPLRA